jgi:tetratricopeptide (TPR) repeat protein
VHLSRNILQPKSERMDAHYNLALDLKKKGRIDEAIATFKELLRLNDENPDLHYDLANAYTSKGQWPEAIRHYSQAVAIDPGNAHAFNNLGVALKNSGDTTAAIAMFQKAIALNADIAEYYNNLGNALQMQGLMKDAIGHFKQAVRLRPDFAEAHYNLGFLLQNKNDLQTAIQHYKSALLSKPGFFEAHNNLAVTSHCLGQYEIARAHYDAAVCIQPQNHDTRWNRAMLLLSNGEFEEGWREFEHRLTQSGWATNYPFKHAKPRWEGLPLNGKRLLIHDEQGFGDTIQFARFLPLLKAYDGRILFETRQALVSLLCEFPGIDEIVVRTAAQRPEAAYDLYTPLLSLPMLLKTTVRNIPSPQGYLQADTEKAEKWREELKGIGLKVGIVWAGNPAHKNNQNRSCALAHIKTLLDLEGVTFFSLQKDVAPLDWQTEISPYAMTDCGGKIGDFSDTAAIIHNLDLTISVDTATAHLAGAMGKPAWVLLPNVSDWRWMRNRSDSPWYRSMRLFRQKRPGDWESVFIEIKNELRKEQCQKKTW